MPGYRSLAAHLSGDAADNAREAELRQRDGDSEAAARLLEEALEASARSRPELPGCICGRLASIYRTLKRYDDEVILLERYRESQTSEDARTRFDARLSKARAIAERRRRSDTGALATVRQVRTRSSQRRRSSTPVAGPATANPNAPALTHAMLDELRSAFADTLNAERLSVALTTLHSQALELNAEVDIAVAALKSAWLTAEKPEEHSEEEWHERYAGALVELLALHFGE
jgi:hypothetical protein